MVIETIAAEMMTLPLILLMFERIPVFALLANILVGPTLPFAMLAATIAGVAGMIAPNLAGLFAMPATIIVGYTVAVVELLSSVPWAQVIAKIHPALFASFYIVLVGIIAVWWRKLGRAFQPRGIVE